MRQRSSGSWELRAYVSVDPETRRRRYRTKTVRGTRAEAERELAALVAAVRAGEARFVGVRVVGALVHRGVEVVGADHDPSDPVGPRPVPPPSFMT